MNGNLRSRTFVVAAALVLCLGFMVPGHAAAPTLSPAPETRVGLGVDSTIPLHIRNAREMGALQFDLSFDGGLLDVLDVSPGASMPPVLLEFNTISPGYVTVALAASEGIDGDARLDLRIRALATGSTALSVENPQAWSLSTGYEQLLDARAGQITVAGGPPAAIPISAVVGGIVVLVVVLVLLAFVLRRRKRGGVDATPAAGAWARPPLPNPPPPAPPRIPPDSRPEGGPASPVRPRTWYVAKGGQPHGPYEGRSLGEMIRNGDVQPHDLVWNDSLTDWVRADSVEDLS